MRRRFALLLLCIATLAACAGRTREEGMPTPETWVLVVNQNWLDMNVYVMRSSQRIRLGTVGGNRSQRFKLPDYLIFGATPIRFMVDPIGSDRTSRSFEIPVSAGDEVTLTIPPSA